MKRLQQLVEALGAAGVIGLGVLLFCLPFYFSALAPLEKDAARRALTAERQRARLPAQPVTVDGAAELARFHGMFPPVQRLGAEVEALHSHARASGLQLQQGEYRLESKTGALSAYRVTLPVRGSYGQIRQFVGRVLKAMPTASVDAVRFERKKAADTQLEAQVRLTLYFRPGEDKKGT
ncbi:MAG TPA: hypothetical protein VF110_04490 [Burkholderiales bacterium]